jgi:hypothetical protein
MTPDPDRWTSPRPTTTNTAALAAYHDGLAALVAGSGHADALLGGAVDADPDFLLARVALAVAGVVRGGAYVAPELPTAASRGERQHAEVVGTTLQGDPRRAGDLRREHLLEFPGDLLVVWLPAVPRPSPPA